jgi:ATP adenylyltransferase
LHWHVVPRWEGDTNFMPVVAETRVMPQHLLDSYDRLKPHFESLSA